MKKILPLGVMLLFACGINAQTVILSEDFESGTLPENWALSEDGNSVGWEFGNASSLSSEYVTIPSHTQFTASNDDAYGNQQGTGNLAYRDRIITPAIDLSAYSAVHLTFAAYNPETYNSDGTVEISTDGGNTWTMIFDIPANIGTWQTYTVELSDYIDESDVKFAFRHNDNDVWASAVAIDDVEFTVPEENDLYLTNLSIPAFGVIGESEEITGMVQNWGSNVISSFEVSWSANDGSAGGSQLISDINMEPGDSYEFSHDELIEITGYEEVEISVSVSLPNNIDDTDASNNELSTYTAGLDFIPTKRVLVEEATGTWCGWCPRGFVIMEYLKENYPETTSLVAVHNNDPMAVGEYDSGLGISSFPGGRIDRATGNIDPANFEAPVLDRLSMTPPASVDVTHYYNEDIGQVNVTVSATFARDLENATYHLNAILVEDEVTGSGNGWGQVNYYASGQIGANNPLGEWNDLPAIVPASQMVYDDVGRALLAGYDGESDAIPSTIVSGESYSASFSHSIESSWDPSNMRVIGVLLNDDGEAINTEFSEGVVLSLGEGETYNGVKVYPNPATTVATIEFDMEDAAEVSVDIINAAGQTLSSKNYGQVSGGKQIVRFSTDGMPSGMYVVRATVDGEPVVRKLVINK